MENSNSGHTEHQSAKNEVRNVTIVLSVLTVVELALGFWMYKSIPDAGLLKNIVKGTIIILMLAKAYYIVAYFMHLKHEVRNMIMTIVAPLTLFVWFIIAFLYDGHSYKVLRTTFDSYYKEQSEVKVDKAEHNGHGADEADKNQSEEKRDLD